MAVERGKTSREAEIVRQLAEETGVGEEEVRKVVTHLGLENALRYAARADETNLQYPGLKLTLLSGKYIVPV